jgi:RNA polymerase sigma-70 factor (ECF subfamily)
MTNHTEKFNNIYAKHSALVLSVVRRKLSAAGASQQPAEDIAQIVWTKAWQIIQTGRQINQYWLETTARTSTVDHLRATRNDDVSLDALLEDDPNDVRGLLSDGAEDAFELNPAMKDALRRLIDNLPPRERLAIELRYFANLSMREVAAKMGVADGTAMSTIHHAVSRLRRQLLPGQQEAA